MVDQIVQTGAHSVLLVDDDGPLLRAERDALDLIGATSGTAIAWVALPAARLDASFFQLNTGLAGAMLQKFVQYGLAVAIMGDLSAHVAASEALAAFVRESNRGRHVWFVADEAALRARLGG